MSKQSEQTVKSTEPATNKQDSILGLLARVFWITIAAIILVRYLDIKFWGGMTAAGGPATIANWNRYTVALLIGSAVIWALFHVANYLIM